MQIFLNIAENDECLNNLNREIFNIDSIWKDQSKIIS